MALAAAGGVSWAWAWLKPGKIGKLTPLSTCPPLSTATVCGAGALKLPAREKNTANLTAMARASQRQSLDSVRPEPDARHFVESVLFFLGFFMVKFLPLLVA